MTDSKMIAHLKDQIKNNKKEILRLTEENKVIYKEYQNLMKKQVEIV